MKSIFATLATILFLTPAITLAADVPAVKSAEIVKMTRPAYPFIARQADLDGEVLVAVQVGTDGKAKNIRILKSTNPVFNDAAIAAAMDAEYAAAEMPSGKVTSWVQIPFQFKKKRG